jgi:hypothetical protein
MSAMADDIERHAVLESDRRDDSGIRRYDTGAAIHARVAQEDFAHPAVVISTNGRAEVQPAGFHIPSFGGSPVRESLTRRAHGHPLCTIRRRVHVH